ncbi:MAG: hypothetical protein R6W31_11290 [Bacteroidales bacterium]
MASLKNPVLKIVILIILVFIILNNLLFFPSNILCWDVFGYYLYLPLKFIYHDMGLRDESMIPSILEQYHNSATFYQAVKLPDGGYVMKYTMGLAILYSPFFFIGHIIAELSAYAADGFSAPYQYSIFFGSIIYSMLAVIVLSRVLMHFFTERISAIILIIMVFSTNYIIHITMSGQNANAYNYLFLAYALILWFTILWHETHQLKHMVFLSIACGMTILSRPSEVVCLAIPVLWGVASKKTLVQKIQLLLKNYYQVLIFAGILALIGSFQFIYWKIQTGKFLYNSYGGNPGEGFEFLTPYLSKVLFSFRKGWLIYTPVMVFAIMGFLVMFRRNRAVFFALGAYLILNLYIVSSWSNWWYTQSFSQRAMIASYPVMAISLGYFLVWLFEQKRAFKTAGLVLLSGLLLLNIFQTVQYANGTIHGDRMTRAYYFAVFGKLNASEEDRNLLLVDRTFESKESFTNQTGYTSRLWEKLDSLSLDSINIYSPAIESTYERLTRHDHAWIRITAFVYPTEDIIQNPFSLVVHFTHNEYPYKYRGYNSEEMDLQLNQWNRITFDYLTPEVRRKDNLLKIYFWNRGTGQIFIDDFQVEVFEKER